MPNPSRLRTSRRAFLITTAAAVLSAVAYFSFAYYRLYVPVGLEQFRTITELAPLFYAPDIDIEALKKETEELERLSAVRNVMYRKTKYQGGVDELYARYDEIAPYPLNFLKTVPDVIKKTDAFFINPTQKTALRLLEAYELTAKSYRKDAERFAQLAKTAFEVDVKNNRGKIPHIVFLGSATTPEIIKNDAELMIKNGDALLAEIAKRKDCLFRGQCELNAKEFRISSRPPKSVPALPNLKKYYEILQKADVRGPFFYPSRCWNNTNGSPEWELLYVLFAQNADAEKTVGIKLATENYYQWISPKSRSPLIRAFIEKGLIFFSTIEANPYRCTNLDFWQALTTMNWLKESIEDESQTDGLPESIRRLENAYAGAIYPSWDLALELTNEYQKIMLAGEADEVVVKRYQMLRGRLADFPATLASINDFLAFFLRLEKNGEVFQPDYWVQVLSFYSLMYLNFSDAVWMIDEKPTYLDETYIPPENIVIPPADNLPFNRKVFKLSVLKKYLSEEEILEIHRRTHETNEEVNSLPLE